MICRFGGIFAVITNYRRSAGAGIMSHLEAFPTDSSKINIVSSLFPCFDVQEVTTVPHASVFSEVHWFDGTAAFPDKMGCAGIILALIILFDGHDLVIFQIFAWKYPFVAHYGPSLINFVTLSLATCIFRVFL